MQASTTKKMAPFDKHSYNNKSVFKASFNYNLKTLIHKDIVQLRGGESKITLNNGIPSVKRGLHL